MPPQNEGGDRHDATCMKWIPLRNILCLYSIEVEITSLQMIVENFEITCNQFLYPINLIYSIFIF